MIKLLKRLFILPPTSERLKYAPYHRAFIDYSRGAHISQNDCYIFYLAARNTFIVTVIFAAVIAGLYFMGMDIRDIELFGYSLEVEPTFMKVYHSTRMKGFVYFYTYWMSNFIWLSAIYYFLLYAVNVDPKTDFLRFHLRLRYKRERTSLNIFKNTLFNITGIIFMLIGTYFSYGLFESVLRFRLLDIRYDNANSAVFFVAYMGFLLIAFPVISFLLTASSGMLYSNLLGRHKNGGLD